MVATWGYMIAKFWPILFLSAFFCSCPSPATVVQQPNPQVPETTSPAPEKLVQPPKEPSDVSATGSDGESTISWTKVTGATSYNLYWSNKSGVTVANGTKIAGIVSPYVHTGLTNGKTYYWIVTAVNAGGETASTEVTAIPQVPAPSAPSDVAATLSDGGSTISWAEVSGATSYNLYWSTKSGVTAENGTKIAGVTSPYLHNGLTNGTSYYWIVTAVNAAGEIASKQVTAIPQVPAPGSPSDVAATASDGKSMISWTNVTGATSYNLYWSTNSGVTVTNGTRIAGVVTPYEHSGLTNGTTYYWIVTAVNPGGEVASGQFTATPSGPPPTVSVTGGNEESTISWTNTDGATSYNLYWSTVSGVTPTSGTKLSSVTSPYRHTGLTNGTPYYWIVAAVVGGVELASAQVTVTPHLPSPTGFEAVTRTGLIDLSWQPVLLATGYRVYRSTNSGDLGTVVGTSAVGSYRDSTVTDETTYYYSVAAFNAAGHESSRAGLSCATVGIASIAAGYGSTYIVKKDGSLWATGMNQVGQLGTGDKLRREIPVQIFSSGVASVAVFYYTTLIVKTDGSLWVCGNNYQGQLGIGNKIDQSSPVQVMASGVQSASAGFNISMIVKTDGTLWGAGGNSGENLGLGTGASPSTTFVQIPISGVIAVSVADMCITIIDNNHKLWGIGAGSAFGKGTNVSYAVPTASSTTDSILATSTESGHTLILKADGSSWGTGTNSCGETGDGSPTVVDRNTFALNMGSGVKSVSAGFLSGMVVKTDGSLWAFGRNEYGKLGDGTTVTITSPSLILGSGVAAVSMGREHSIILKTDGSLWATGDNRFCQFGDGTAVSSTTPVQIRF